MPTDNTRFQIDIDLLKKYDKPGPRYTSYPTAPQFNTQFGPNEYITAIKENNIDNDTPLSLYFHIPFCDTLCYFCGCNMMVTKNRHLIDDYIELVKQEIALIQPYLNSLRKVAQLHWGGGSPSYLQPYQMRTLFEDILNNFEFAMDAEIGVEFDPRGLTEDQIRTLHELGFNRGSLGVQDFNPEVQKYVNRIQPEEMTRWTVDIMRQWGFRSINIDLIYGLPLQTADEFEKTIDIIIDINPERIAVFNFAYVPWMKKHQRLIKHEDLPSPEEKLTILKMVIEKLTGAGYIYIGMDHFAHPDDELAIAQREKTLYRNFQGYSTKAGCDLYAFGITSISMLPLAYAQNVKTIREYRERMNHKQPAVFRGYRLTDDDVLRRYVITRLMCDFELEKMMVEDKFNIQFDEYFKDALEQLKTFENDGLVILKPSSIAVTPIGRFVIRNIAMCFDAYLSAETEKATVFSRTV